MGGKPQPFAPKGRYAHTPTSLVVLHLGPSPTADIYLRQRFAGSSFPIRFVDMTAPIEGDPFPEGAFVVIVRYLGSAVAKRLEAARDRLAGVAYLMDDDIPGVLDDPSLPRLYAWKVALNFLRWRSKLSKLASEVWLSSPGLMGRYGSADWAHRVDPLYIPPDPAVAEAPSDDGAITVFYHAERTHLGDTLWLRGVAERVLAADPKLVFEVIGRRDVKRAYAGMERVRVLHPQSWGNYLATSKIARGHIGLAALAPTPFNQSRSFNKIFDITRMGAAGIYADVAPYEGVIEDGKTGLLLARDEGAWAEAILALAGDPDRRSALHDAARDFCLAHNAREMKNPLFDRFR